jgi:rod shape-determining protein MreC
MPVITPDGVVGKVRDVFPFTAQVLEINDETSGLGIILTQTRLRGILRGNTAGQTEIIDVLPDERIRTGEQVVTSGGDNVYPSGLPVGTVERVVNDPERNPYVAVLVRPSVNLSRLDEVLVITETRNTIPATMQQDIATSEQKAADILAQRLPSVPPPPTVGPDGKPINANTPPSPVRPPPSLHPDQFTPDATPPASNLTPGAAYPNHVFPAQPPTAAAAHPGSEAQPGATTSKSTAIAPQSNSTPSQPKPAASQPKSTSQLKSTQQPKATKHSQASPQPKTNQGPQN